MTFQNFPTSTQELSQATVTTGITAMSSTQTCFFRFQGGCSKQARLLAVLLDFTAIRSWSRTIS